MQQLAGQEGREQQPSVGLGGPARNTEASSACKKPRHDLAVTTVETAAKASRQVKQAKPSSEPGTDIDMAEYEKESWLEHRCRVQFIHQKNLKLSGNCDPLAN